MNFELTVPVHGQGLYDVTHKVAEVLRRASVDDGLVTVFVRHTSASLVIQENADPTVRDDLLRWFARLVPERDALYTHTAEGPDDMPAHIKSALTAVSVSVPVIRGELALGTWQGIYLWEHRHHRGERRLIVNVLGDAAR
jgi:secondary thiamine-phosphate synthase enzyme